MAQSLMGMPLHMTRDAVAPMRSFLLPAALPTPLTPSFCPTYLPPPWCHLPPPPRVPPAYPPPPLAGVFCRAKEKDGWAWEHQALLLRRDAVAPMRSFLLSMLADKTIPLPGDVDVLTGGPPCQVQCVSKVWPNGVYSSSSSQPMVLPPSSVTPPICKSSSHMGKPCDTCCTNMIDGNAPPPQHETLTQLSEGCPPLLPKKNTSTQSLTRESADGEDVLPGS